MLLTKENAAHLFDYKDGNLVWKIQKSSRISVGQIAGSVHRTGYIQIIIDRRAYLAHRIVYLLHHGFMPDFLDHIDGNRQNNRIENLRPTSKSQNSCNRSKSNTNTSGYKGVSWRPDIAKWHAQITIRGRKKHLGYFDSAEDAALLYAVNALRHHGEFARM